jgi:hypothetical protein
MGVKDLLVILSPFMRQCVPHNDISSDDRVGFDVSAVVHVLIRRHATQVLFFADWVGFDRSVEETLVRMKEWGADLLMGVADGRRIDSKQVNTTRADTRSRAAEAAQKAFKVGDTPSKTDVNTAIGAFAPAGSRRFIAIAKKLGVTVVTALFQAEEQLVWLQDQKVITVIAANDGDYIALGADNIMLSNELWSRHTRFWTKKSMKNPVAGGGSRGEEVNDSTAIATDGGGGGSGDDGSSRSTKCGSEGGAVKKAKGEYRVCDHTTHQNFEDAVVKHGYRTVLLYSLLADNDYSNISGVGTRAAMEIATVAAAAPSGLLKRAAQLVYQRVTRTKRSNWRTESDVLAMLETGLIMFNHSLVFNPDTKAAEPMKPLVAKTGALNPTAVRQLQGHKHLAGVDVAGWYAGEYDVISAKKVPLPPVTTADPNGNGDAGGGIDGGSGAPSVVLTDETDPANWSGPYLHTVASDGTSKEYYHNTKTKESVWDKPACLSAQPTSGGGAALPPASIPKWPIGEPSGKWSDAQLKLYLKSKSQAQTKQHEKKEGRVERAVLMFKNPGLVIEQDDVVAISQDRAQFEKKMWAKMEDPGWKAVNSKNAKKLLPVIAASLLHEFKAHLGAGTERVTNTEDERYLKDLQVLRGSPKEIEMNGSKYKFEEVWVKSKVGRSRGNDLRTSFAKLTVAMPANLAVAIEHSGCLYPKNSIAVDGSWLGTKAFKPCRQSAKGCGHGFVCLKAVQSPNSVGITEGARVWGRDRDKTNQVDPKQSAVQAVFSGKTHDDGTFEAGVHPITGGLPISDACPFGLSEFAAIKSGLSNSAYLEAAHAMVCSRKKEYARVGGTKEGNPNLVGRSLKIESVLPPSKQMIAHAEADREMCAAKDTIGDAMAVDD